MGKQIGKHGLSTPVMSDLLGGVLKPLLDRVRGDTTLDMELRQEYINIYYRGGNLLRVSRASNGSDYEAFFDSNFGPEIAPKLPSKCISTIVDTKAWLDQVPLLKDTMDLWFGKFRKAERASQQLVVYENNASPWAGGTDYVIVDFEYNNHIGACFDLVALRWHSDPTSKKLYKNYLPKLTAIEIKAGDGALKGKAGLLEHYQQWKDFFGKTNQLEIFKQEMLQVFQQKRELGLIPALKNNPNKVVRVADDVDVVFLLANHDPASGKLKVEVDKILEMQKIDKPKFNLLFATATFMGYGLYKQNMLTLVDFKTQLDRISKKTP
jgi:hypothetical protein